MPDHDPGLVVRIAGLVPGEIDLGNVVTEWPADEIEFQREGDWTSFTDRWARMQALRKAKLATSVLDLLTEEGRLRTPTPWFGDKPLPADVIADERVKVARAEQCHAESERDALRARLDAVIAGSESAENAEAIYTQLRAVQQELDDLRVSVLAKSDDPALRLAGLLGIEVRHARRLAESGVRELSDMADWTTDDLMDCRNVGVKSHKVISEALARLGQPLAEPVRVPPEQYGRNAGLGRRAGDDRG